MLTSLFTGVSGMNANGTALSAIGDNIANMNTVGFKASRVSFGDVLGQTLVGASDSSQIGRGAMVRSVTTLFSQGSLETTTSALDLAIEGDGFFVVNEDNANYYTRAGQFSVDKDWNIVNPDGAVLQGYLADAAGNITGAIGNLQLNARQLPSNMTTNADISANLDAGESIKAWAFTSPSSMPPDASTYNKSSAVTVYDSQGGAHDATLNFVKTGDNAWTVHYIYQDSTGQYQEAGSQNLSFGTDGSLTSDNTAPITFNWGGGVANNAITFNFGTGTADTPSGTGLDMSTQFSSAFGVTSLQQDGYASGSLKTMVINQDGVISGVFTNGQLRALGKVALARFIAPTGLSKLGRNLYSESNASGQPIIGSPETSGLGAILSSSLEQSNVDLAQEFTTMITAQRGFQANSRIITTTDELLQELVNLKR